MKRETKQMRISRWFDSFYKLGFKHDEIVQLRRIEITLSRWSELECGNSNDFCSYSIERDEETGKPFMVTHSHSSNNSRKTPIADREAGALKRLAKIMENHPTLWAYHQGDPRGCALYIGEREGMDMDKLDSLYNRGVCANY